MSEVIIESRLYPPKLHTNIVIRHRLLDSITRNIEKNFILISSPAGYGKTTLVQNFLRENKILFAWLQFSNDIRNIAAFTAYFVNSIKKLNPEFGSNTMQLVSSIQERRQTQMNSVTMIEELMGTFVNEFIKTFSGKKIVFVIDDLQIKESNSWLKNYFNLFSEIIPENFILIITSREIPDFNIAKITARRNLFQIGEKELTFTKEETAKLLEEIYNIKYSDSSLKLLSAKLEGWITGLHLLLQTFGKKFDKVLSSGKQLPENIFNYFANEIFGKQDKNIQNFLIDTASFEFFNENICREILGIKNSAKIISGLLSKNIFIQQSTSNYENEPNYEYQILFKNFLLSKLKDYRSASELKKIFTDIIEFFIRKEEIVTAIDYCFLAHDKERAKNLLINNFSKLYNKGFYESLWKWILNFDEEEIMKNASLSMIKGILCKYFFSELETGLTYLQNAIEHFEKKQNKSLLIESFLWKSSILTNLGRTQEALEDLIRLVEVKTTAENKAKILYSIGLAFYINTEYDEALEYLNKSSKICLEKNFKDIQLDINNLLGQIYLNRGDFIKSTYYYEQNFEKTTNIDKKYLSITNLTDLYAQAGKYEKANEYLELAAELKQQFAVPIFHLLYLISAARLRFEVGDFDETIKLGEELNSVAKKYSRKYQIYFSYRLISAAYLYLGQVNKAEEYLKLAAIYINEQNQFQSFEFSVANSKVKFKKGVRSKIEDTLLKAYDYFKERNFLYDQIQTGFQLAEYYLASGSLKNTLSFSSEVLNTSEEKEYISFLEKELYHSRIIFDYAIKNNLEKKFIKNISLSSLSIDDISFISNECRARQVSLKESFYDISMQSFGRIEFKVRGSVISEDNWKRKMRKTILAYMLLYPERKLTKERAIELFFPDSPIESVENIFHQSISNIRSAVKETQTLSMNCEGSLVKEATPEYILYTDKVLQLNPDYFYFCDAKLFNEYFNSVFAGKLSSSEKISVSKNAVELYKGKFMEGVYLRWCDELRAEFESKFIKICTGLNAELIKSKNYEEVVIYGDKIMSTDKLNEQAYLSLIEAYIMLDNANKARDTFGLMLKAFNDELGEKPSSKSLNKVKELLAS